MGASPKTYKGRGVVLHTIKYGETSVIAYLLTDVGGRRTYMVQGVRSSRGHGSKMSLLQPMFAVEFEGFTPLRGEMHRFREIHSGITLSGIPFDARKSAMALFMAEVLYRLIKENESDEALFEFVWNSVGALDSINEGIANFHLWFLAHLSRFLGFYPGNRYSGGDWFDLCEGLYTAEAPLHGAAMSPQNARIFNDLVECDVRYLGEIGLNRVQRVEFLEVMLEYYRYHLDAIHTVQSIGILREVF